MHGSLMVGAFFCHVFHRGQQRAERACPHACCEGLPATLTHTFRDCAAASPVVRYLGALWAHLDPRAPPLQPTCLITGEPLFWAPSPGFRALWVRVRLYFLQAVWAAAQAGRCDGRPTSPAHILCSLLHSCRNNMRQDWQLATSGFKDPHSDAPTSQLRGLSPKLSKERFFAKWGGHGHLCREVLPDQLQVLWTLQHPVPFLSA